MNTNLQCESNLIKKSGFTLVELIVVVALIGILMAIVIPRYSQYMDTARMTKLDTNARTIYNACVIAETELIAQGISPTEADIIAHTSNSLSMLVLTASDDTGTDDTYKLLNYIPSTGSEPGSFEISNITEDSNMYVWLNGVKRTVKARETLN